MGAVTVVRFDCPRGHGTLAALEVDREDTSAFAVLDERSVGFKYYMVGGPTAPASREEGRRAARLGLSYSAALSDRPGDVAHFKYEIFCECGFHLEIREERLTALLATLVNRSSPAEIIVGTGESHH